MNDALEMEDVEKNSSTATDFSIANLLNPKTGKDFLVHCYFCISFAILPVVYSVIVYM